MTPDQGAHPGRAPANDGYVVISHLNLTAETEGPRDRREREKERLRHSVSAVPLSLRSLRLPVFITLTSGQPSPAARALPGSSPYRSRGDERPAAPRAAGGISICVSS